MPEILLRRKKQSRVMRHLPKHQATAPDEEADIAVNEELAERMKKPVQYEFKKFKDRTLYQHCDTGTLHWLSSTAPSKFECTRLVSARYSRVNKDLRFTWPFCSQCVKKVPESSKPPPAAASSPVPTDATG